MKNLKFFLFILMVGAVVVMESCSDDDPDAAMVHVISAAAKVSVDRFSATAGHLMVRDATNGLPAANTAVNFDQEPFITTGLGPTGQTVEYYNFDVQPVDPAPIYVLFKEGASTPVDGQLNIIDVVPGDPGYNDFWLVNKVTVPASYTANEVASLAEIQAKGYPVEETTTIVNCPVVPEGSTATKRLGGGSAELVIGWYREKVVAYFSFEERTLIADAGKVPTSPIYVCFNINPADMGGGPASGFKVEMGSPQTHNVVATIPASSTYSPLWVVEAYDNADFEDVSDLTSAETASSVGTGLATVNCPVVAIP